MAFGRRVCVAVCVVFMINLSVAAFMVRPDSGVILVRRPSTGSWNAVKDSAIVAGGDSLYLDDQFQARLLLGPHCKVLLRGELRANLVGSDSALAIILDAGQIFFKRENGAAGTRVKIVLRGCTFEPIGTAASIKYTKQGEPTVAVLSGSVRVEPPAKEPYVALPGTYCTYDPVSESYKEGKLPPEAITSLEQWSGATINLSSPSSEADTTKRPKQSQTHVSAGLSAPQSSVQPAVAAAPRTAPANQEIAKAGQQENSEPKPAPSASASAFPAPAVAASSSVPVNKAQEAKPEETNQAKTGANAAPKITWALSVSSVTVNNQQWTRLAFSPDIPIWKFGIGLDVELFLDAMGNFSDKGWNFDRDDWAESLMRKIRYLRFGYENDPVYVKVGGLSNVTLGYGFVVDRFTNMLHYPDQKLLGLQFDLNNISPLGVTLQTVLPDFLEFKDKGGIAAARLALCPLKTAQIPILSSLSVGATYGVDLNEYAPARSWTGVSGPPGIAYWRSKYSPAVVDSLIAGGDADTTASDMTYRDSVSRYALFCGDAGISLVKTAFFGLDLYGQAAVVADTAAFKDTRTGWGFGAPGVALRAGPVNAGAEYRHVRGKFIPGYFDEFYLDERLQRYPFVQTKSQSVVDRDLDGVFGQLGFNIADVVMVNGSYQYLSGPDNQKDQRVELAGSVGDALLKRIPKITKAEVYLDKRNIGSTVMGIDSMGRISYDSFFDLTPSFYYGYRIGIAVTQGASIVLDTRFGYRWDTDNHLVSDNNVTLQTAITF